MKKRILPALYSGNLILGEQHIPNSPEYQKLIRELDCRRSHLAEEEEEKLDDLLKLHTEALSFEVEEAFYRGFAAGVLLMQEVQSVQL